MEHSPAAPFLDGSSDEAADEEALEEDEADDDGDGGEDGAGRQEVPAGIEPVLEAGESDGQGAEYSAGRKDPPRRRPGGPVVAGPAAPARGARGEGIRYTKPPHGAFGHQTGHSATGPFVAGEISHTMNE